MQNNTNIDPLASISPQCTWIRLGKTTQFVGFSTIKIYGSTTTASSANPAFTIPCDSASFQDFYTFDDGAGGNRVDNELVRNNVIAPYIDNNFHFLLNSVFIGNNASLYTNNTKIYNNTIGNSFINNTIGSHFYENNISHVFSENIIGFGGYYNRSLSDQPFCANIIGSNFSNNIVTAFYTNTIGPNFNGNIVEEFFTHCSIGTAFRHNTIGAQFEYNSFGNSANCNLIYSHFLSNTVNNEFQENIIGSYWRYSYFGERFKNQDMSALTTSSSTTSFRYNEFAAGCCLAKTWTTNNVSTTLQNDKNVRIVMGNGTSNYMLAIIYNATTSVPAPMAIG
jgi:hypothetical protein